jgi:DHA2 family multidrug resistance protein
VIPLSQTILLDTFPKRQQGLVTSIFGMAVVIGPVIGPTVGSMLSELYSWRWAFYMIVPVGLISFVGLRLTLPARPSDRADQRLDWTGFLSLSVAIACVQLVLSRGQRLDWFESSRDHDRDLHCRGLAFWVFLAHSLTDRPPVPQSAGSCSTATTAIGLVLVLIYGMLNFTPMVLLPPLLQQHAGFPDCADRRGHRRARRRRHPRLLPRHLRRPHGSAHRPDRGLCLLQTLSGVWLMAIDLNVDMGTLMLNSLLQGHRRRRHLGAAHPGHLLEHVSAANLAEGTAVYHLLRNIGSSFFISICVAEIVRATSANYGRMVELVNPFNRALALPWVTGGWDFDTILGLARLSKEIGRQSAMIGYINAFGLYTACSAMAIPLILLIGRRARR